MSFIFFTFQIHFSYIVIANLVLIFDVCIYILRLLLQFHLSLYVLFLFSLYAHASY